MSRIQFGDEEVDENLIGKIESVVNSQANILRETKKEIDGIQGLVEEQDGINKECEVRSKEQFCEIADFSKQLEDLVYSFKTNIKSIESQISELENKVETLQNILDLERDN